MTVVGFNVGRDPKRERVLSRRENLAGGFQVQVMSAVEDRGGDGEDEGNDAALCFARTLAEPMPNC